jgi:large subunit ribosomal protein L24
MDIRSGDNVEILAGRYRGKQGVVERVTPETQRVVVRGLNMHKRHVRAGMKGAMQGGIVDFAAPVSYSNVALVCNKCNKKTRISKELQTGGKWAIVCKECGKPYERPAKA